MKPRSKAVFHFTKSLDVVKSILAHGFFPRYCLEDVNWLGYEQFDYIAYPMVCFCDIPITRISEHIKFYGNYGIGLTKEWAISNQLNPISYISLKSSLITDLRNAVTAAMTIKEEKNDSLYAHGIRHVLSFNKPIMGTIIKDTESKQKEFYQESEWRYIPKFSNIPPYMTQNIYNDIKLLEDSNSIVAENCALKFNPKDVKYIFVPNDTEIPDLINFINSDMDNHPSADIKILMTRIVSVETINADF